MLICLIFEYVFNYIWTFGDYKVDYCEPLSNNYPTMVGFKFKLNPTQLEPARALVSKKLYYSENSNEILKQNIIIHGGLIICCLNITVLYYFTK